MVRIISVLLLAVAPLLAGAQEAINLVDNPPDRHIVVRGDTLWGIAGKFLKEPWRWPELWRLNKADIRNPHRIYPGDVVLLDLSGGEARLRLATPVKLSPEVRSQANREPIPSIPQQAIAPFLSQPLIIDAGELDHAPRIIATQEDRVFLGNGDSGFVKGIDDTQTLAWHVYRPGKPLTDPETAEVLGYEAFFLGNARLIRPGDTQLPAQIGITSAKEEIGRGDYLVPARPNTLISYLPHRPEQAIEGRVLSIYGGLNEGGPLSVINLNRGSRDGLETGHVLALWRTRSAEGQDEQGRRSKITLPDERYALVFVFRVFERVAYALVMEANRPVIIGDRVRAP